ncbi:hypothetical protein B4U80_02417, partial [Leptotrombidium deliense]
MLQNLAIIGAMPGRNYKQVRIHWLLNLIKAEFNNGDIRFDFSKLDELVKRLHQYRLKPGFELMGNPSNIFSNFSNATELHLFKRLVTELSSRYVSMFGIDFVKQWNFENWNEPNNRDFDGLNFTFNSFNNYYDACSSGLKETSEELRLGGVSERCLPIKNESFCMSLLNHTANGINYFSKKKNDTKLDFIALHEKGKDNDVDVIIEKEITVINAIHSRFPQLRNKQVMNEEGDPIVKWSDPYIWNTDSNYASIAAEIMIKHIDHYFSKNNSVYFQLLSNDNAFLSYYPYQFEQRTLLARFQMNNTKPQTVQFIKKPIYTALGLFDYLGDNLLFTGFDHNEKVTVSSVATFESTEERQMYAILVSASPYKSRQADEIVDLKLVVDFNGCSVNEDWKWRRYVVNNIESNPYKVWTSRGKPDFPSKSLLQNMRNKEGPFTSSLEHVKVKHNTWKHSLTLYAPEVTLFLLCSKSEKFDEQILNLKWISVSETDVLFVWSPVQNKCILSYHVEYSEYETGKFERINKKEIIYP